MQVQLSVIDDGTLAIEATVHQLLAQWPYLSDLSLIWAVASIFEPASPSEVAGAHVDPAHQAAAAAAYKILQEPAVQPWLYFNLIAHNSHVFAPIMDLVGPDLLPHLRCRPQLLYTFTCRADNLAKARLFLYLIQERKSRKLR